MNICNEQLIEMILDELNSIKENELLTIQRLSKKSAMTLENTELVLKTLLDLQAFCKAYELDFVGPRWKRNYYLGIRGDMSKYSSSVIDWFLETEFFRIDKHDYSTEIIQTLFTKKTQVSIGEAIERVTLALRYRDELNLSELCRNTLLPRRMVMKVTQLMLKIQDALYEYEFRRIDDAIAKQRYQGIYHLDDSSVKEVLTERYLSWRTLRV